MQAPGGPIKARMTGPFASPEPDSRLTDRARRLLAEANRVLSEAVDYPSTLSRVANLLVPDLADWCFVDVLEEDGVLERMAIAHADPRHAELARELGRFPLGPDWEAADAWMQLAGEPVLISHPHAARESVYSPEHLRVIDEVGARAYVLAPLVSGGKLVGSLTLIVSRGGLEHGADELRLIRELARRGAAAIEAARRQEKARRSVLASERNVARMEQLLAISSALSGAVTPAQVVDTILNEGVRASGASIGSIYLLSSDCRSLGLIGSTGIEPEQLERFKLIPTEAPLPIAAAARTGQAVWINSAEEALARFPALSGRASPDHQSLGCVPLRIDGPPIGVLQLGFREPRTFDEHEQRYLRILAQQCAQALERSRLYAVEQAARAAADAERETLDAIFTQAPVPVVVFEGPEHVIAKASPLWRRLVDREVIGKRWTDAFPDSCGDLPRLLDQIYARGEPIELHEYKFSFDRRGGEPPEDRYFNVAFQPLRERSGAVTRIMSVLIDVTDQVRARQKLEEARAALETSEHRYRQLADAMPQIVWTTDSSREVDYINPRWFEYSGMTLEETQRLGWLRRVHPEDVARYEQASREAARRGEGFEIDYRLRAKDGSYRWFLTRMVPIRDAHGSIVKHLGTATDIDELKQLQAQRAQLLASEHAARMEAEHANRMKDEFLARVSHELSTPLFAMKMWIEMLKRGRSTARALEAIEQSARAQAKLVDDLLDVSRAINGKLQINPEPVELVPLVDSAVAGLRPQAEAKRLELVTRYGDVPLVRGDAVRIQQIVSNLVSNAIKFTPEKGRVEVELDRMDDQARLRVRDTGQGISREFLPHMFSPFRQADTGSTRAHGGLGLGLAIVRQLVMLHGGAVHADSEGEGRGATFTVLLPAILESELLEPAEPSRPRRLAQLGGVEVLLVEDDDQTRTVLAMMLEQQGATIRSASSAAEAIEQIKARPPHVVLCDIAMPEEDGYSLIRRVRALGGTLGRIPAAALTAHAREEDRVRALGAGFDLHIAKPAEPAELIALVSHLAGKGQKMQE